MFDRELKKIAIATIPMSTGRLPTSPDLIASQRARRIAAMLFWSSAAAWISLGEPLDEVENLSRLRDPEGGCRLVEKDDPVVPQDRAGHRYRLALASRQGCNGLAHGANRRHRERFQGLRRALLHRRFPQAKQ